LGKFLPLLRQKITVVRPIGHRFVVNSRKQLTPSNDRIFTNFAYFNAQKANGKRTDNNFFLIFSIFFFGIRPESQHSIAQPKFNKQE
jgi:hypothetical protein